MYSIDRLNQPVIIAKMQCKIGHPSDNRDMNNDDYIARITNDELAEQIIIDPEDAKYELPTIHQIRSNIITIAIPKNQIKTIQRLVDPLPLKQDEFEIINIQGMEYITISFVFDPVLRELLEASIGHDLMRKIEEYVQKVKAKNKETTHLQTELKNSKKEAKNNELRALKSELKEADLQNRIDKYNSLPILHRIWRAIFHGV